MSEVTVCEVCEKELRGDKLIVVYVPVKGMVCSEHCMGVLISEYTQTEGYTASL